MSEPVTVFYTPWDKVPDEPACRTEHRVGLRLLAHGLEVLHGLRLDPGDLAGRLVPGPHGKPGLPDCPGVHFNVSHCQGLAVCAFSGKPVGADVERPGPFRDSLLRVLSEGERRLLDKAAAPGARDELFFRLWTLKECCLKRSGVGITLPLTDLWFDFPNYPDTGAIVSSEPGLAFLQRDLPGGFVLSVCSEAPMDLTLVPVP